MSFFKNLIFAQDGNSSEGTNQTAPAPTKQSSATKFPETAQTSDVATPVFNFPTSAPTQQPTTFASTAGVSQEHLEKAIELYENGFNSLNQDGFDFFEFFQSVSHGGITNPQVYAMAYAMGTAMDKTISKEKLMSQADFYVSEITKVYEENVAKGQSKKDSLLKQKESENQTLANELSMFQQQLEALQIQIADRQNKLQAIDGKYQPQLADIDGKLTANTIAKNKIVEAIQTVKTGININIK
jgi:hypothetical protein